MVKLKNARITKYGSVQVSNDDLERFAYAQLKEYDKNYFKEPHALNIDDFVEFYLKKKVYYYQLSLTDTTDKILGTTTISDGRIVIINDDGELDIRNVKCGEICIDEKACVTEERRRFTLAHEAWHSQFDLHLNKGMLDSASKLKDTVVQIEQPFKSIECKTPLQWIEYHANKYPVYLMMPKRFVVRLFKEKHHEFFKGKRKLSKCHPQRVWLIIISLAKILQVSKKAMAYRLKELFLISDDVFLSLNIYQGGDLLA